MTHSLDIALKRAYVAPAAEDGLRVLVERLWPRGVTKSGLALDHWAKEVAPSPALRRWYGHLPERWPEFEARYLAELEARGAEVDALVRLIEGRRATFVYAARDETRNSARVLKGYLERL